MSDSVGSVNMHESVAVPVDEEPLDLSALRAALGDQAVPPPKLYRIGEVVEYSGFSRQTIHNYTAMGLLQESRWTEKGHRLYDAEVFRQLALIKYLKDRYSLAQIKRILDQSVGS